jgi:hypothetical protein
MIDRYLHQNLVQSGKNGFKPLTYGFGEKKTKRREKKN